MPSERLTTVTVSWIEPDSIAPYTLYHHGGRPVIGIAPLSHIANGRWTKYMREVREDKKNTSDRLRRILAVAFYQDSMSEEVREELKGYLALRCL